MDGPSVVDMSKENKYIHWYDLNGQWIASTKEANNIHRSDTGQIIEIHFDEDTEVKSYANGM